MAARLERGKVRQTEDNWPWLPSGPDIPGEVAAAVAFVCEEGVPIEVARSVAERLQSDLHLPALKEALSCLIPEALDSVLDDQQKKASRRRQAEGGARRLAVGARGILEER